MDPGIDDAWALVVAASRAHLQGVSAVAGNVSLAHTYSNAQEILRVLDHPEVSVWPGAANPTLGPLITAEAFHGRSGTGSWQGSSVPFDPGAERVWTHWAQSPQSLAKTHLVATGPLTNLAVSLLAFPRLQNAWQSVTCMCGALPGTQVDKSQEFNIYVDPHAADVVFHWMDRLQILGINVAHRATIPLSDLPRLHQYGAVGKMLFEMLDFYSQRSRGEGGNPDAFPIDDVCAVAAAIQPDLFAWVEMPLAVVREGPLRGTVVVSPLDLNRQPVRVAADVSANAFRQWVWDSMEPYRTS